MALIKQSLTGLSGLFFMGFAAVAQAQTDMIACYGETIEISLLGNEPRGDDDGSVIISLPNTHNWQVYTRQDPSALHLLPCQEEPVVASYVHGNGLTGQDGHSPIYPNDLRRLSITGGLPKGLKIARFDFSEEIAANGTDLPSGFRGILQENHSNSNVPRYYGRYQFPADHLSPLGERVLRSCGRWVCQGAYGVLDRLYVSYEFANKDMPLSGWLEQDTALQNLINGWIE